MMRAATIEDITTEVQETLNAVILPAGVRLDDDQRPQEVEADNSSRRPFERGDLVFLNFADDQCAMAATPMLASCMICELAKAMAPRGQIFNTAKSEFLDTVPHVEEAPQAWGPVQLEAERDVMRRRRARSGCQDVVRERAAVLAQRKTSGREMGECRGP